MLDWKAFEEWCLNRLKPDSFSRFESDNIESEPDPLRQLEKIEVELWQAYNQRNCMQYEMRDVFMTNTFAFWSRFVLPEEEGVLLRGGERLKDKRVKVVQYECQNKGCREYWCEEPLDELGNKEWVAQWCPS